MVGSLNSRVVAQSPSAIRHQQRSDMKNALHFASTQPALWLAAIALSSILALQMLFADHAVLISAPAAPVSQARLAPGTEGLLRRTAEHLSKMHRGESIGGFSGFEPPDDDEKYRRKIKDQTYTAQDVNDWVKQINNFLNQIVKKNPGLSLEKVLQRQGLSQVEIREFVEAIQRTHNLAKVLSEYGVKPETVKILESLLKTLKVPLWSY
jgi:hypothetical protein